MPPRDKVDLTNCDREPIHIPGSIQPHGALLACDANAAMVLRHSANVPAVLGLPGQINGSKLEDLVGSQAAHALRNALSTAADPARPALLLGLPVAGGGTFDVAIHRHKSTVIVEFEVPGTQGQPLQLARTLMSRVSAIDDVDRLVTQAARLVRGVLGYDRVMIYRFEQDGAGKVVAEHRRAGLESFLGQYFPASDIPQQARELYLRNTIRIIGDSSCERVMVVPELDDSGEALDLSYAHLRSVSPIHCEYLRNMGVAASMSISIVLDGALWGLIACHHYEPRVLSMAERVAAEMFGEVFSLHLNALKEKKKLDTATRARDALDRFLRLASHHTDVSEAIRDNLAEFAALLPCDGVGLLADGQWHAEGAAPPAAAIPLLARMVNGAAGGRIWGTHALVQELPEAAVYGDMVAGVLAVPLSQLPRDYLFFFRKELERTLDWAGDPTKSYESGPLGDRLTPRKSFAIWKETVRGQAQPWTDIDRQTAEAARASIVEVVLRHGELMAEERSKAAVRQRMLNEELNHRVKNILAVIKSLVGHPVQEGRSLADYVASLKGRIQSLAFAHDQVVRGDGGGQLSTLINAELSPYRSPTTTLQLEGAPVWLDSRAFSVMALVLHELATNAAKYGALSRQGGRLEVRWALDPERNCSVTWEESGGPPVSAPGRSGFGTALIDRSIPFDLGGRSEVDYARDGLKARFLIPARHVGKPAVEAERRGNEAAAGVHLALPADLRVLLVEDQMLIALDTESMLTLGGVAKVATASSASEALERVKTELPDAAVLDVNLGGETSIPVAEELTRRKVPFVFATGYGDSSMIPPALASVPIVRKPCDAETLLSALARAVGAGRDAGQA